MALLPLLEANLLRQTPEQEPKDEADKDAENATNQSRAPTLLIEAQSRQEGGTKNNRTEKRIEYQPWNNTRGPALPELPLKFHMFGM